MSKQTAVYRWWQVASDIAAANGYDDVALEALAQLLSDRRKHHGEDAIDGNGGFIALDEHGQDPMQAAGQTELSQYIYRAIKEGRLQAYYPSGRPMPLGDEPIGSLRLTDVCVEPDSVNALLKEYVHWNGHEDVCASTWIPPEQKPPVRPEPPSGTWHNEARAIADELDMRDAKAGTYSSLTDMGDRVATEMRKQQIHGPNGPLSGSTVKREALQGGRWVRPRDEETTGETGETRETTQA